MTSILVNIRGRKIVMIYASQLDIFKKMFNLIANHNHTNYKIIRTDTKAEALIYNFLNSVDKNS